MNIAEFSSRFAVRRLEEDDIPAACTLCRGNPIFYEYCPPEVSEEGIREDMRALPPGKTMEDKYYIGYFDGQRLIAVMDFIDGYPRGDVAFIGFFMMDKAEQEKGIGSAIIEELCGYLSMRGYAAVRLGWVKGNAQSEGFWYKNGFAETGASYETNGYTVIVAERPLE